jgi:hypothetical protein
LSNLQSLYNKGYDIVLEVDVSMFAAGTGSHNVTFMGGFKVEENGTYTFKIQTWGDEGGKTVNCSKKVFEKAYAGAVWGKAKKKKND